MSKIAALVAAVVAAVVGVFAWSAALVARGEKRQFERQKRAAESVNRRLAKIDKDLDARASAQAAEVRVETDRALAKKTKTGRDARSLFRRIREWGK